MGRISDFEDNVASTTLARGIDVSPPDATLFSSTCFSLLKFFGGAGRASAAAAGGGSSPLVSKRARIETMLELLNGKGHQGRLPGLPNLGNTCFMNAVLQCLLNTPGRFIEACTAFADLNADGMSGKRLLGLRFAELVTEYGLADEGALSRSSSALKGLKGSMADIDIRYAGCEQQDAYEFLGCILEGLEDNFTTVLKTKLGPYAPACFAQGVVRSVCGVQTHSTRWCHGCGKVFDVDHNTDTVLRLPLISPEAQMNEALRASEEAQPVALKDLIDTMQAPEDIEGYDCEECAACARREGRDHVRTKVTQRAGQISGTGDVLMIALYRFLNVMSDDGRFNAVKINRDVAIPTVLSFETGEYRLHGVVSHVGKNLTSGHYISAVRSLRDHQWYHCDDEKVSPIHLRNLYEVSQISTTRADATPFILFYHRFAGDMESAA
eukprot:TRINITY_DN5482_c0_g1_i1.p1 TRINITY_DN5482_c0_g1~~TRINITY_DN5482_c0_g1_i1.p1  ORF type:complete len:438 (+),score=104.04 TRINITY_DN5482_c0_g1_i1:1439-2752(+)